MCVTGQQSTCHALYDRDCSLGVVAYTHTNIALATSNKHRSSDIQHMNKLIMIWQSSFPLFSTAFPISWTWNKPLITLQWNHGGQFVLKCWVGRHWELYRSWCNLGTSDTDFCFPMYLSHSCLQSIIIFNLKIIHIFCFSIHFNSLILIYEYKNECKLINLF